MLKDFTHICYFSCVNFVMQSKLDPASTSVRDNSVCGVSLPTLECFLFVLFFLVQELSSKTKELLSNIRKLAGQDGKVSIEQLRARKLTPATETFLFSVASVEGLAQL